MLILACFNSFKLCKSSVTVPIFIGKLSTKIKKVLISGFVNLNSDFYCRLLKKVLAVNKNVYKLLKMIYN